MKPAVATILAAVVAMAPACTSPPASGGAHESAPSPSPETPPPTPASRVATTNDEACPAARPARWPNPELAPLDPQHLADAIPERAENFERNDIEFHPADPERGSDAWIRTYYDKKRANARFDVVDLAGQCRLRDDVAQQLYQRELRYAESVGEPLEERWFRDRRFIYQKSAEGRALTTFLANRCRVTMTLEYGDTSRYIYELAEQLDLDDLEEVCASRR